jgi:predicted RNase H-like HicB family nuclease
MWSSRLSLPSVTSQTGLHSGFTGDRELHRRIGLRSRRGVHTVHIVGSSTGTHRPRSFTAETGMRDPTFAAVIQRDGKWWIGWVAEIPGVNWQGGTREELLQNLTSALGEALEMNRADALAAITSEYEEVRIQP